MDATPAELLATIKNGAPYLDKLDAARRLSDVGEFWEVSFRRRWEDGKPAWDLESINVGDRGTLPEIVTLYRVSDPEGREGVHWATHRTYARLHLPFWHLSTPMWTTRLHRDDPRILAHVRSNGARGEVLVHPEGLDIQPATGGLRADLEDIATGAKSSRPRSI